MMDRVERAAHDADPPRDPPPRRARGRRRAAGVGDGRAGYAAVAAVRAVAAVVLSGGRTSGHDLSRRTAGQRPAQFVGAVDHHPAQPEPRSSRVSIASARRGRLRLDHVAREGRPRSTRLDQGRGPPRRHRRQLVEVPRHVRAGQLDLPRVPEPVAGRRSPAGWTATRRASGSRHAAAFAAGSGSNARQRAACSAPLAVRSRSSLGVDLGRAGLAQRAQPGQHGPAQVGVDLQAGRDASVRASRAGAPRRRCRPRRVTRRRRSSCRPPPGGARASAVQAGGRDRGLDLRQALRPG